LVSSGVLSELCSEIDRFIGVGAMQLKIARPAMTSNVVFDDTVSQSVVRVYAGKFAITAETASFVTFSHKTRTLFGITRGRVETQPFAMATG